jgi:BASS family bile acid:Na+ symporter
MGRGDLIDDYLLLWVLLAVATGVLLPEIAVLTQFSTPILAIMIGSVSLTLSVERFREISLRMLGLALAGHAAMPAVALAIARLLDLSPALTVGFVLVGAVTPELVSPTMTELAGGKTALTTTVLVVTGIASLGYVPGVLALTFGDRVGVDAFPIAEGLFVAVVLPMVIAVGTRTASPEFVSRYDDLYPSISALMVIAIIGGVTAANVAVVRSDFGLLVPVGLGVLALNAAGYLLGWVGGLREERPDRIALVLSVGTRDFAVAAALIVASGLPAVASLPAVVFGIVEMVTSAGLARYFGREQ